MRELELKKHGLKVHLRDPSSYTPLRQDQDRLNDHYVNHHDNQDGQDHNDHITPLRQDDDNQDYDQ